MSINLTIFPTEAPAVVWFEDGSSLTADPQQEKFYQLPSGSFCTISSTAAPIEASEHPSSPEERAVAFAERMVAMWVGIADKAREKALGPTATPL